MKRISKMMLVILMMFALVGCSCSNEECKCPTDTNTSEESYVTINNGYKELYKKTAPSVVMVRIQRKSNGEIKATGSGVVAFEEGNYAYVITNAHVVKDMTADFEVEVFFSDEEGVMVGNSEIATVMGKDFKEDVAILQIAKSNKYKVVTLGDSSKISKGDFVYTIGSPYQKFNHTTSGAISNYNSKIDIDMASSGVTTPVYAILFDAPINKGNSGGALFNGKGELIGITTLKYDQMEGIYGALPINYFIKVAKHLLSTGTTYQRPTLNFTLLSVNEMTEELRELYDINVDNGVYIQSSFESNVEREDVERCIIKAINDINVKSNEEFQVELLKYNIGNTVTLTLIDNLGQNTKTVTVTLHV